METNSLVPILSSIVALVATIIVAIIGKRKTGNPVFYSDDFEKLSQANKEFRQSILDELKSTKLEVIDLKKQVLITENEKKSLENKIKNLEINNSILEEKNNILIRRNTVLEELNKTLENKLRRLLDAE